MRQTGKYHFFTGLIYIPPRDSTSEQHSNAPPASNVPQQDGVDALAEYGLIVLVSYFNAWTGSAAGTCTEDFSDILDSSIPPRPETHLSLTQRKSADSHTCDYGKTWLRSMNSVQ